MIESLRDEERAIIGYLRDKETISRSECASLLGVSSKTAYRYLRSLEDKGLIARRGKGKNTHYILLVQHDPYMT